MINTYKKTLLAIAITVAVPFAQAAKMEDGLKAPNNEGFITAQNNSHSGGSSNHGGNSHGGDNGHGGNGGWSGGDNGHGGNGGDGNGNGDGEDNGGNNVPEPSTLMLLGAGLFGIRALKKKG